MAVKIINQFTIDFLINNKIFKADCQETIGTAQKPMVRACITNGHRKGQVFIFYRTKEDELFWYDLPNEKKQNIAWQMSASILAKI